MSDKSVFRYPTQFDYCIDTLNDRAFKLGIISDLNSNPGQAKEINYRAVIKDDGVLELEEDGYTDVYKAIQSHRDSCELSAIIERYKLGDENALNRASTAFLDTTKMPRTYAQVLQTVIDGENVFKSLSPEVRSKYNNDFNQWFAAGLPLQVKPSVVNKGDAEPVSSKEVLKDE